MDRSYSIGFEYIDDTAAHTGRFWQLQPNHRHR
jgi:hypothetical protein